MAKLPRPLWVRTAALPLLTGAFLVAPSSVTTAGSEQTYPRFGVQFQASWDCSTNAQRLAVLDKLDRAGVQWIRVDFGWRSLQARGPHSYEDWYVDRMERVVNAARRRGFKILGVLSHTPEWANGGQAEKVPPNNPADYARVARWLADRFKGRVAAWQVWNEPNHPHFFSGSASDYAELLKAAYPAFKLGNPEAPVVTGGTSYNDTEWLAQLYQSGTKGFFDVLATHPYQGVADQPPETPDDGTKYTLAHVGAVHDLMVSNGDGGKPIWFTEFGWSSHENWEGIENWMRGVSARTQGAYLVRTLRYLARHHPYVTHVFWYNDRNTESGNIQRDRYGLLQRDMSTKIAYRRLKDFMRD